jgi:4-amino-4-deoxy-L-arabinose transferase-like glycosyltransferase
MSFGERITPLRGLTVRATPRLRFAHGLAAVVAVALIVRVAVVVATPHYLAVTDAGEFDHIAVSLADHGSFPASGLAPRGGPTAFRPPLFPVALAAVYKVVGVGSPKDRWAAGRVLEAVLGAVAVGLICLLAWRLWGPVAALVAGTVAAVDPPLVLVGSSLLSEPLFIVLELGAVLAALAHRDSSHRWRWAVATGVLVGLAELTRGNGVVLLAPLGFIVWSERPRWSWRSLRAPAAMVAAAALTLVPWTVRDLSVFHQFVPLTTESGFALAGTYNFGAQNARQYPAAWRPPVPEMQQVFVSDPTANEAQVSTRLDTVAMDYIKAHPGSLATTAYWNTLRLLNLTGPGIERAFAGGEGYPFRLATDSVYAFWVLLALAIVGAFSRAVRRAPLALWGCPLVILLSTVMLLGLTRYRSPADPFIVLLAALGLISIWHRVRTVRTAGTR